MDLTNYYTTLVLQAGGGLGMRPNSNSDCKHSQVGILQEFDHRHQACYGMVAYY